MVSRSIKLVSAEITYFLVLVSTLGLVTCQNINNIGELSAELHECLQLISDPKDHVNETKVDQLDVQMQSTCLQEFVWKFGAIKWSDFNITEHDIRFINSLTHSLVEEHNRVKRQVGPGMGRMFPRTGFRIRREYRRLTDRDRFAFHQALNVLKRSGEFDTFANLHRGTVVTTAHRGPNFFGWHRVYCALIEEALRRVNFRVSLPYWDSSLDFDMDNPVNSIIWSTPFLGNGDGFVTTGPFANWDTPVGRLTRNIAGGSRLLSKEVIRQILTRCRTSEISDPTAEPQYNLELAHGGPHVWVGGQMSGLNTAAHDPVFILHHAFIDYLWEIFRIGQARRCGVNPNTDYPPSVPMHERDRRMDGFPQYRNIDGYRGYWTRFWYRYEGSPTCNRFRPFCGTPYLRCDVRRSRCVSVARRIAVEPNTGASIMAFGAQSPMRASRARAQASSINVGPRFAAPPSDGRTQDAGFRGRRRKRAANQTTLAFPDNAQEFIKPFVAPPSDGRTSDVLGFNIAHGTPSTDPIGPEPSRPGQIMYSYATPMPLIPVPELPASSNKSTIQNMNKPDINKEVYIPVGIVYQRPIFRPINSRGCLGQLHRWLKINVKSEGLNYRGSYKTSEFIDTSLSHQSSMIFPIIQLPKDSASEIILSAKDECGRHCQAQCLKDGQSYQPCDGVLRVDQNYSLYGKTVREVTRKMDTGSGWSQYGERRRADIQFICPGEGQQPFGAGTLFRI